MSLVPLTPAWLSVHLYYNEPWETFLKEAVQPYLKIAMGTGIAEQYYFERNWEKGPHIRLHIQGDPVLLHSILKTNLAEHFENYFESKPSTRIEPVYPPDFPEGKMWLPNHTIQFVDYQKSLDIFENPTLRALIADHHFASTKVCLDYIATNWTYDDVLGTAIKLQIAFAFAVGMDFQSMEYFFGHVYKKSLKRSVNMQNPSSQSEADLITDETNSAFQSTYVKQKNKLIPFIKEMYYSLLKEETFKKAALNTWVDSSRQIANKIILAVTQRQIHLSENKLPLNGVRKVIPLDKLKYWPIYEEMIAATNNRLGILNKDEAFLAFILFQCIGEVKKTFINS